MRSFDDSKAVDGAESETGYADNPNSQDATPAYLTSNQLEFPLVVIHLTR